MQNRKEYVQIRVKIFIVIWHTFPVLLNNIFIHTCAHRETITIKHEHKEERNT